MDSIGRYQIKHRLADGGMAEVYLTVDSLMGRDVAVKLLPKVFMHDQTFEKRFEQEARLLARLEHPAIVPVYDFGDHDGQPYMVSRFMKGGSLLDKITREGALPLGETMEIALRLCRGLTFAHEAGIIHRDIKPANILFDENGRAYVEDFGIAKLAESTSKLTGNALIGTPAYMSPEQFSGVGEIDHRSDQYSLGIVLFEMLSGELPFKADTTARLMKSHLMDPPPDLRTLRDDLPEQIELVIQRMLNKKPEKRYPSISVLSVEFEKIINLVKKGEPVVQDYSTQTIDQIEVHKVEEQGINQSVQDQDTEKDIYTTNVIEDVLPLAPVNQDKQEELKGDAERGNEQGQEVRSKQEKRKKRLFTLGAFGLILIGQILNEFLPYGHIYIYPLVIAGFFALNTREFDFKRMGIVYVADAIIWAANYFGALILFDYAYTNRYTIFVNTPFNNYESIHSIITIIYYLLYSLMVVVAVLVYRKSLDLKKWKRILAYAGPPVFAVIFGLVLYERFYRFWYSLFISSFTRSTIFRIANRLSYLFVDMGILAILLPLFYRTRKRTGTGEDKSWRIKANRVVG